MSTAILEANCAAKLDPREVHYRFASSCSGLSLFLRYLPPITAKPNAVVLYVHGGTFSSALSIAHRFDGRSWRDALSEAGFHVWGLDFHGFGLSDPYPEMAQPAAANPPLGRAEAASQQLDAAIRFIVSQQRVDCISIIAHSWGSIVSGRLAGGDPN